MKDVTDIYISDAMELNKPPRDEKWIKLPMRRENNNTKMEKENETTTTATIICHQLNSLNTLKC